MKIKEILKGAKKGNIYSIILMKYLQVKINADILG